LKGARNQYVQTDLPGYWNAQQCSNLTRTESSLCQTIYSHPKSKLASSCNLTSLAFAEPPEIFDSRSPAQRGWNSLPKENKLLIFSYLSTKEKFQIQMVSG
jgi:hypothetical protein